MVFGQQKRLVADHPSASFSLTLASRMRGLVLVAGVVIGAHAHASSEGASAPAQPNRDVSLNGSSTCEGRCVKVLIPGLSW